ncbi:flagellar hook capping FlgD N-terminal domain-containing protein [Pararhodobacter sp. CCB-MM2]|uniref:flagellar hook capping FlgD N-terminal domain-containing protein n=1 Tax=Pararhodobacter sp. CCB-MM2 TaxID=1786003 RepID=UPI000836A9A9|nr:flagellar hook capping FlgD N-terminal domain-containing protein [Pararhodobacter sp. CCB-MM2]MCA2011968.1 flagellar hook assembly protein FlgD [Cereibacter sphaeroides]
MEVTSSAYGTYSSSSSASTPTASEQTDYITFLQMLTTQMQNQDPLNPMEASDFAVQLATFAGVEQATYTNQLLGAMMSQTGLSDLGNWVGMEARIYGGAYFDGSPVELTPDPALGADEVTLIVRDSNGVIVDNRSIDPEGLSYSWDGTDSSGNPLPDGSYTFEIESKLNGETLDTSPVAAYVEIMEARYEGGATMLVLPGGFYVDSSSVTGLRRPVG